MEAYSKEIWTIGHSMISDVLKLAGWRVMHIRGISKAEEHPYTSPARIIDGRLSYKGNPV